MSTVLREHQIHLEELFNKNQLMDRIRKQFTDCPEFDFSAFLAQVSIPVNFGIEVLAQMALRKRADLQTMVGVLRHLAKDGQECADLLLKCAEEDLIDWSPTLRIFIVKLTITEDVQAELDRFQYPLPMVVAPNLVTSNKESGYLCKNSSLLLKNNHHSDDICLDHINRMNQVMFKINHETSRMIKNQWKNLDKPKDGESKADFERRVRAFQKYDKTAKDVIKILIEHGNEFYFTHKVDKRGRTYCQGHHANYQGTPWNKAVIEFAQEEVTT